MLGEEYVLGDVIGRGGSGIVYRARSLSYGDVAVKKLPGGEIGRLDLASLRHPHVVPVYAQFVEDGALYLVMPLACGTLRGRMDTLGGPTAHARAARLIGQIAAGLQYLHHRGLLHLDLKPANVLLLQDDLPMLSDLSMGQGKGSVVGTPAYMAPEQCLGRDLDARTDQYALALVAFELLTGKRPYAASTLESLLEMHVAGPIPPAGISTAIDAVIVRGMAKAPAERFESVTAFAAELAAAIESEPLPTQSRLSRLFRRRRNAPPAVVSADGTRSIVLAAMVEPAVSAVGQETTMTATRLMTALAARE